MGENEKIVRAMSITDSLWSEPQIHGESLKLGIDIRSQSESLNHTILTNEQHLGRFIVSWLSYHHSVRTQLSPDKDAPQQGTVYTPGTGTVIAVTQHRT